MAPVQHIAPHARGKVAPDVIFVVGGKAKAAKAKLGNDKVIDGSVGILLDDNFQLALLPSVEEAAKRISSADISSYAPIKGMPNYLEDVPKYLYGDLLQPETTGCLATAGATGALRLSVWNFLEQGDAYISHDHCWGPYRTIARDALREVELFQTFTESGGFNVDGALEKVDEHLKKQGRALLLINTPCHNPTGMSITTEEAQRLRDGLTALAEQNKDKPLTLLIDGAYWEFGGEEVNHKFLEIFQDLPENLLFCLAYTLSKSLTRYGLRTGALVVKGANPDIVKDVVDTIAISIRTHWSNTTRYGQVLFSTIFRDPTLLAQLRKEQAEFTALCNTRGKMFMKEADEVGLPHTPYHGGFFGTLPCSKAEAEAVSNRLFEENIFLVPLGKGVRVAFCAISTPQIPGLAAKIKAHFPG